MVQLTTITTRSGDKGKTSLGDGGRIFKDHLRIQAIGDIDETNCAIGLALSHITHLKNSHLAHVEKDLLAIQNHLFDVGADICLPTTHEKALRIKDTHIQQLDAMVTAYNGHLKPLNSFILPCGSVASGYLHVARSVARRGERSLVALSQKESVNPESLRYMNRLSDVLFVMARVANNNGHDDVLWEPGKM
jgi:cob(I)alamin adenosyltransferase